MDYEAFLEKVIDDSIEGARKEFLHRPDKLMGAIAGFEACRKRTPTEIRGLLIGARQSTRNAYWGTTVADYSRARSFETAIEWAANCVSARALFIGDENMKDSIIVQPTANAMRKTTEVIGLGAVDDASGFEAVEGFLQ